ncbi:hypothetical protein EDF57_102470 [Novosphingobium sp. PhB55]|nr:hypothetical protein EDF57_102470 [Novosphingobium sp. PhB55]
MPVPADASPAFIAAAADENYLPDDAVQLYTAWRKVGVPAELHVYERGGHGFDLKPQGGTSDHWFEELIWWMQSRGLMVSINHSQICAATMRYDTTSLSTHAMCRFLRNLSFLATFGNDC